MPLSNPPAVYDEGSLVAAAPVNFTGSAVSSSYNSGTGRVDVTVSSSGGGSANGVVEIAGSGTSDVTTATQISLDSAEPSTTYAGNGKGVRFLGGDTIYTDALTLDKPWHGLWEGTNGLVQVHKYTSARTTPQVTVSNAAGSIGTPFNAYAWWRNIYLYGNRSGPYNADAMQLDGIAQFYTSGCDFEGWDKCVYGRSSLSNHHMDSTFANCNYGIYYNCGLGGGAAANNVHVSGSTFTGCDTAGIYLTSGSGMVISGCNFENNAGKGIILGAKHIDAPSRNVITDCYFESNTLGGGDIAIGASTTLTVIRGCGGNGGFRVNVDASAGPVLIDGCDSPVVYNSSATSNVRVINCNSPTIASGSVTTTTGNW